MHLQVYSASSSPTNFLGIPFAAADSAMIWFAQARSKAIKYAAASSTVEPQVRSLVSSSSKNELVKLFLSSINMILVTSQSVDLPVILKNQIEAICPKSFSETCAFLLGQDDAAESLVHGQVLIKHACVC